MLTQTLMWIQIPTLMRIQILTLMRIQTPTLTRPCHHSLQGRGINRGVRV